MKYIADPHYKDFLEERERIGKQIYELILRYRELTELLHKQGSDIFYKLTTQFDEHKSLIQQRTK